MKKQIALVIVMICLLMLCACGDNRTDTAENIVDTPYGELEVPTEYEGNVTATVISEDPYTLAFKAEDGTVLYTLCFGGGEGDLLGTVEVDGEKVEVYATFGELDSENENFKDYCSYQDGINTIINGLKDDGNFTAEDSAEADDGSTFDIETSVVTMKYPAKWKDAVQIEETDNAVKFSNNGTPLFDLVFEECDGYLLGTYNGTPIYIVDYDVETDEQSSMQDAVNVILKYLNEDPGFVINK